MRVAVFNADTGGCGHSRLIWPAQALAAHGHPVTIQPRLDAVRNDGPVYGDLLVDIQVDADVVVLQRPCKRELVESIPVMQRRGIAVVVDVDDLFHDLPKGHPTRRIFAPMNNPDRNWRLLQQACDQADLVTTTTPALARRYATHGRSVVLPNCVPQRYLETDGKPNDRVTVGWTGTTLTHTGDLDVCGDAISRVQADTGCAFRAIGSQATLDVLGVDGEVVPWCALTDPGPDGYAARVASLDVGLVPLVGGAFTRAKSALKMLEYAALGVVPVMSASPDNVRMFQQGIGFLADTPADWFRHVRALVTNDAMREDHALNGREVMRGWTYEGRCGLWWEAWTEALANRRGSRAA